MVILYFFDIISLLIACVYGAVERPFLALHYLGKVVNGGIGESRYKPPLPVAMHSRVHFVLCQLLFIIVSNRSFSAHTIPSKDLDRIQDFLSLTIPDTSLDLSKLNFQDLISFYQKLASRMGEQKMLLTSPIVAPHSRIYHHIENEPYSPEMYAYKLDSIRADMYSLTILETKLLWINDQIELAVTALTQQTGQVLQINHQITIPATFLLQASWHFEAQMTLSPSIINGVLNYSHFMLAADLLASIFLENDQASGGLLSNALSVASLDSLDTSNPFRIPITSTSAVRKALVACALNLLLSSLSVCDECMGALIDGNFSDTGVPCEHGFGV